MKYAAFDCVDYKALIFKLRQRAVDGQSSEYKNYILSIPHGNVLGPIFFILHTHDMQFGIEKCLHHMLMRPPS